MFSKGSVILRGLHGGVGFGRGQGRLKSKNLIEDNYMDTHVHSDCFVFSNMRNRIVLSSLSLPFSQIVHNERLKVT